MPVHIPASLVRCILSIHKFFHAMPSPSPSSDDFTALVDKCLFPTLATVKEWNIEMHFNESRFGELMTGAFVRKLYFVKASFGAQHEHVVAEIHHRTSVHPPVRYLRLERVGGNKKLQDQKRRDEQQQRREQERRVEENSLPALADTASESSRDSLRKRNYDAMDTVRVVRKWAPTNLVYTMTFTDDDHVPSLEDLAIAAQVAHEEDEQYTLLEHQCYWWADTLMAILESTVEERYRVKKLYHEERKKDNEVYKKKTRSGKLRYKWVDIPVYNRDEVSVSHLNSRFEACKAPFEESRLEKRRLKEEAEFFKGEAGRSAESQRVLEEGQRVLEAKLKAAEDARQASEDARQASEVARQAERLEFEARYAKLVENFQSGLPLTSAA
ncbi:hypothetical protein D9615_009470 [Tricholomella constricta]|uniref:Uncharacterized protein n=1 Tax=Tricholomella constricta TaxID=117010 RepID=A0A8H5LX92_9AGAR|nr:hypothetical protein D9615_009470 [Tricholomella constricta]